MMVRAAPAPAAAGPQAGAQNIAQWWEGMMRRQSADKPVLHYVNDIGQLCSYTYREVNAWAHCLAAYLLAKGAQPQQPVLILAQGGPSYLVFDLACHLAGLVNITLPASVRAATLGQLVDEWKPEFLLIDSLALYRRLRTGGWRHAAPDTPEVICRPQQDEEAHETDEVTLFDHAVAHGKESWRWAQERIAQARNLASPDAVATYLPLWPQATGTPPGGHLTRPPGQAAASGQPSGEGRFRFASLRHCDLLTHPAPPLLRAQQTGQWLVYFQPWDASERRAALYGPVMAGVVPVWVPHWTQFWAAHHQLRPSGWQLPAPVVRRLEQQLRAPHRVGVKKATRMSHAAARWVQTQGLLQSGQPVPGRLRWHRGWDQRQVWTPLRRSHLHRTVALLTHAEHLPPATAQFFQALGVELFDTGSL